MKIAWTFLLAVLAALVHAECSGGHGGGPDMRASISAASPIARSVAAKVPVRSPAVASTPVSRMAPAAVPARPPVKTAKVENWSEATCSGGAGGGMDVNGNQCGYPAHEVLVAAK